MVRPHAPARVELRPRRRDDQQRRLRPALGQRAHEIERSRVGPVQVLEGEHDRLRSRGRQNPCRHRRQLPAAQLLRREFRCAVLRQEDIDQRREQRRVFGWVEADQNQRILEVGQALVGGQVRAEAVPAPFGDRMQRRILQQLRRRPLDPGVRRLAKAGVKLLHQPGLAQARLADDQRELALAFVCALPAPGEKIELLLTPDERRQRTRAAAPAAAACAHHPIERHGRRHPLELVLAAVLRDKQPGGLALHGRGDEDRARLGGALDPRGDIRRIAEHFARCVDHHLPGIKADPRGKLGRAFAGVSGVDFDKRALDRERRTHRALGIVLLRVRIAEQRHQPVAELFQHIAAEPSHRRRSLVKIGVDECAPVLGVKLRSHACGPDEVTKHDCDRAALGGRRRRCRRGARRLGDGFSGPESGDRLEETLAVPERDAELLEIRVGQISQDFSIDRVLAEKGEVLAKPERTQPSTDVHDWYPTGRDQ